MTRTMKRVVLNMTVEGESRGGALITVRSAWESVSLEYDRTLGLPFYLSGGPLVDFLRKNEKQLCKVLFARDRESLVPGDSLDFVIMDEKDVLAFNDRGRIIVMDRRDGACLLEVKEDTDNGLQRLYADGSYFPLEERGAVAALLDLRDGTMLLHAEPVEERSSNLVEMLSVIRGLEALPVGRAVRIISDSMYVRKGLSEWLFNWKLNGWRTATGKRARHVDHWKRLDALVEDRCVELQWVRGVTGDPFQALCDREARRAAVSGEIRTCVNPLQSA